MSGLNILCIKLGILILSCVFQAYYIDAQKCTKGIVKAVCNLQPDPTGPNSQITGTVRFTQKMTCKQAQRSRPVMVKGEITGLPQSESIRKLGFHVHANGDISNGCRSIGLHYNPLNTDHGGPADPKSRRHVGDLGNVIANRLGKVTVNFAAPNPVSLYGDMPIIGRTLDLHEREDDLGRGGKPGSTVSGNAGASIACCIIERVLT
ncbi:superoxide dismutase [Cu-Zn]-like [Mercenaria mercenaria]|uniref:superoxide dismutase [Cu-Zn]-like n=1 Tax=Mercenaria mercenaria TaxID=6596 RepID=UPI00234F7364|nr:superoxide dismutase [Cu-Zn]-like [Mercenaria mercenaria]